VGDLLLDVVPLEGISFVIERRWWTELLGEVGGLPEGRQHCGAKCRPSLRMIGSGTAWRGMGGGK